MYMYTCMFVNASLCTIHVYIIMCGCVWVYMYTCTCIIIHVYLSNLVWFPDPSLYNRMREGEGRVWANARPWRWPWNFISIQETQ